MLTGGQGRKYAFSHTLQLDHHGRTDQRTDKASYRVACPQLKMVISRSFLVCTPACACDQLLCVTEHQLIFANPRWLITKTCRNSCNSIRPVHATLCFSWLIQSSPININFSQTSQLCSWAFPHLSLLTCLEIKQSGKRISLFSTSSPTLELM